MNEDNKTQIDIKNEVLNKIKSGQINMRSKAYFLVKLGFLSILTILITLVSVFLLSFVLFSSSLDGSLFLVRFGGTGLYNFILTLPWYLLLLDIFLLILLDMLLKSFSFGYKSPVVFLFGGTFLFITIISTLINFTPLHQKIMNSVEGNKSPLFHNIYDGVDSRYQKPGTWKGYVGKINGNSFQFKYVKGITGQYGDAEVFAVNEITVVDKLMEGDLVFVAGNILDNRIMAYGIKKLNK
jgi:hypothetical protein